MISDILGSSLEEWRKHEAKLIIWGNLGTACMIARFLEKNEITFDGFAVNQRYYDRTKSDLMRYKVYCLEEYLNNYQCDLIVGFSGYSEEILKNLNQSNIRKIYLYDFLGMLVLDRDNTIDKAYLDRNRITLESLEKMFSDEKSKKALEDFLNQKRKGVYKKLYEKNTQYFDEEIIKLHKDESLIDCGAFQGETIENFIDVLHKQGISGWRQIIAVEADPQNVGQMRNALFRYKNITIEEAAVSDKNGYVYWSDSMGQSSRIDESGKRQVRVKTIDEISCGNQISFIKMDIEGTELQALRGGAKTICTWHPRLAICVYHRPEDLITIPQYIKSLCPQYKLFLRNYSPSGVETVLYALMD